MRIWLIGASGLLGSAVAKRLSEARLPFIGTLRSEVDVSSDDQIATFVHTERPTHIINCTAYTDVDGAETNRALAHAMNAEVPERLGKIASSSKAWIMHFSTDYVFDGTASSPYTENAPCSPLNYYGQTKLEGEQRLAAACRRHCIIRTSSLFGDTGKHFVGTILGLMQSREELSVVSDQVSRPTYSQDLAAAAVGLLDATGIYHYANSPAVSWYDYAVAIREVAENSGLPLKIKNLKEVSHTVFQRPAKRPAYSVLATNKAERLLGTKARPWRAALEEYFDR